MLSWGFHWGLALAVFFAGSFLIVAGDVLVVLLEGYLEPGKIIHGYHPEFRTNKMQRLKRWATITVILLSGFIMFGSKFIIKQSDQTQSSALWISSITMNDLKVNPKITMTLKNQSDYPLDIQSRFQAWVQDNSVKSTPSGPLLPVVSQFLSPGGEVMENCFCYTSIQGFDLRDKTSFEKQSLYFFGIIIFRDPAESYNIERSFCFRYDPLSNSFAATPFGNVIHRSISQATGAPLN